MVDWRPEQHPRNPHNGQFVDRVSTSGWVSEDTWFNDWIGGDLVDEETVDSIGPDFSVMVTSDGMVGVTESDAEGRRLPHAMMTQKQAVAASNAIDYLTDTAYHEIDRYEGLEEPDANGFVASVNHGSTVFGLDAQGDFHWLQPTGEGKGQVFHHSLTRQQAVDLSTALYRMGEADISGY